MSLMEVSGAVPAISGEARKTTCAFHSRMGGRAKLRFTGVAEDTRMMDSKASEEKVDMYHFEAGADGTSSKRSNQHIGDLFCCRWSGGLLSVPGIQSRYQVSGTKARDMPRGPRREPPLLVRHKVLVPRPLPRDECPRRRPNGEADGER